MTTPSPKNMSPDEALRVLEGKLDPKSKLTIADAAEKSGLALRDAETGLHALVAKYRGHLSVTSEGELLFSFPTGFSRPWIVETAIDKAASAVGHALLGVARFVVRAWVAIVLVGYALIFLAVLFGLATARSDRDRDSGSSGALSAVGLIFRVLADAFFWMWHPFSPFSYGYGYGYGFSSGYAYDSGYANAGRRVARRDTGPKVPFYERVDRFFFGPPQPKADPLEAERLIVSEIRARKGRIGVADVMRVTGMARAEADGVMSKLMLDYDGDVAVTDDGAIVYRFSNIRKTAEQPKPGESARASAFAPRGEGPSRGFALKEAPPLTGNSAGANLAIGALNGFNLLMSLYAIGQDLTLHRLQLLLAHVPVERIPLEGTPIALGVVPLLFSLALFALPLARLALRPLKKLRIDRENTKLAVRKAALQSLDKGGVTDAQVKAAVEAATGRAADDKAITKEIAALGGDVDNAPSGAVRYRFPDLEREAKALEAEREAAAEEEARVGKVVFSSES